MTEQLQFWAAIGVVVVTAAMFVWRAVRQKKTGACGGGCGCEAKSVKTALQKRGPSQR